jgi:hypothetical protein
MHVSALSCKMGKSNACCKINKMTYKYVSIALVECCTLNDGKTMYGHAY